MRRAAVGLVIAIVLLTGSAQAGQKQIPPAAPVAPSVLPDSLEVPFAFSGPQPPVLPATVSRDDFGRATLRAVWLAQPLRLDGRLDEAVYSTVEPISEFIQNESQAGAPATEKTDVWVTFDNEPSSLALAATGCASPKPSLVRRPAATPRETRARRTEWLPEAGAVRPCRIEPIS